MKYIKQFGIILSISFIGEILNRIIPLPVPASIYGIVILFLCLEFNIIHISSVKETGTFLLEIMPLMFIPAAVGLLSSWSVLRPIWTQFIIISIVTTVIVMAVSGLITQAVIRASKKEAKIDE